MQVAGWGSCIGAVLSPRESNNASFRNDGKRWALPGEPIDDEKSGQVGQNPCDKVHHLAIGRSGWLGGRMFRWRARSRSAGRRMLIRPGLGRRLRLHVNEVVVVTFTNPDRCRIGREDSVESLCRMLHPRRRADRARSAVKAP
jgi:hypothetical protein